MKKEQRVKSKAPEEKKYYCATMVQDLRAKQERFNQRDKNTSCMRNIRITFALAFGFLQQAGPWRRPMSYNLIILCLNSTERNRECHVLFDIDHLAFSSFNIYSFHR